MNVRPQASIALVELTTQQLDLAMQCDVFFFELANADGWRDGRHMLVWRQLQSLLQPDHRLLQLNACLSLCRIPSGISTYLLDVRFPLGTVASLRLRWTRVSTPSGSKQRLLTVPTALWPVHGHVWRVLAGLMPRGYR